MREDVARVPAERLRPGDVVLCRENASRTLVSRRVQAVTLTTDAAGTLCVIDLEGGIRKVVARGGTVRLMPAAGQR